MNPKTSKISKKEFKKNFFLIRANSLKNLRHLNYPKYFLKEFYKDFFFLCSKFNSIIKARNPWGTLFANSV